MKLIQLVITDILKQKRSLLWLIVSVIPLGTTGAMFLDMYIRYSDYLFGVAQKKGITSWEILLMENHGVLQWGVFLPLFVAIISTIVHNTEYSENSWKNLLSLPISRDLVYISKFITILFFSFIIIVLNSVGLVFVGKIIGFPEVLNMSLYSNYVLYQCVGILGVAAIHTWLSSMDKNPMNSILTGFVGMIFSSIILYQFTDFSKFFPYLHPFFAVGIQEYNPIISVYGGIIYGLAFLVIGLFDFRRKDIL